MPNPVDATSPSAVTLPSALTTTPEPALASGISNVRTDVVDHGKRATETGVDRYRQSIASLKSCEANSKHIDHVTAAPTDLSKYRATKIEVEFRTAIPQVPNAQHAFIEITRSNGSKQDLAAYPSGKSMTHEGEQLQFEAGAEKAYECRINDRFTLTVPPGMTRTEYANSLVEGAKSYNAHAVRYDGIGEQVDRFNSNSFVASLLIARGGATGLRDVEKIATQLDSGAVTTHGQPLSTDDRAMAERVRVDHDSGRLIATGFGNAGIESPRFEHSNAAAATPPPFYVNTTSAEAALDPISKEFTHGLGDAINRFFGSISHH
jgi:hypothetical protein